MTSNYKIINLKEIYPSIYKEDYLIEVSEEVYIILHKSKSENTSYRRKLRRWKAQYSIDAGDGIEYLAATFEIASKNDSLSLSKNTIKILKAATPIQLKRILKYFYYHKSLATIAEEEGVSESAVSQSIKAGIAKIKNVNN